MEVCFCFLDKRDDCIIAIHYPYYAQRHEAWTCGSHLVNMRQQLQEESQAAHDDEAETQEVWIPDCGTEQNGFLIKDLRTERMREVIARGQEGTGVHCGTPAWVNGWMVAPITEKWPKGGRGASLGGRC